MDAKGLITKEAAAQPFPREILEELSARSIDKVMRNYVLLWLIRDWNSQGTLNWLTDYKKSFTDI